ncbi:MAG: hypothetical protein JNJ41_12250 [Bacteroidia bacterium]|nr:hypothetical protein [Bacteroidia bacterium]
MCKIFLFTFSLHFSSVGQKKIQFEILYGTYTNDHYNRKFYAAERKWIVKRETLIYFIDAHDTRYSDTIKLKSRDIDSIIKCIKDNELTTSIIKDLSKGYLDKYEWTANISGQISLNGQNATFSIKTNSSSVFEEDKDVLRLKKLEETLYKIVEVKKTEKEN